MSIADKLVNRKRRVCFSFAAYAKEVIENLRAAGISTDAGLSEQELFFIESNYGFVFPPDLRSILQEGLPVGAGFPNWRAASPEQIGVLLALPSAAVTDSASKGTFWCAAFGPQPQSRSDRSAAARTLLDRAPLLVPIYRNYYLPSDPCVAGNPVFSVRIGEVRCAAIDLANFFNLGEGCAVPAWAGKSARRVEVWTEIADAGRCGERAATRALDRRLVEMGRWLREAGWGEEEVREMRLMGSDGGGNERSGHQAAAIKDRQSVMRHVRLLGMTLLRAGWSADDVAESTGWGKVIEAFYCGKLHTTVHAAISFYVIGRKPVGVVGVLTESLRKQVIPWIIKNDKPVKDGRLAATVDVVNPGIVNGSSSARIIYVVLSERI